MDAYHVVLYIHLLALFTGVTAGSMMAVCLLKLRSADTLEQVMPWGQLAGQVEKAFPVAIVGLYGSGIYMTHKFWSFSDPWVVIPIVGLAVLSLQGPLVAGRQGHKLSEALKANGPGRLGEEARQLTVNPLLWAAEFSNMGLVLAIVFVMTTKPGWGAGVAAVVIGYAAGAAVSLRLARREVVEAETVTEPA